MNSLKESAILKDGYVLLDTFSISYPHGLYKESLYSTTYDELSRWLRGTITYLKEISGNDKNDELITYLNSFRGKLGNIDRVEFVLILSRLEERLKITDIEKAGKASF